MGYAQIRVSVLLLGTLYSGQMTAQAASSQSAPPLPAPSGTVVNVSTEAQLQAAVSNLKSNTTIVLAPGIYNLSSTAYLNGSFSNVGIRGATNNAADVVLVGRGMANASYGGVPYGIWVGGNVQGLLIANLTIRDVYYHPIILNAGTESPRIYNVRLRDAGEQFLKSNPDNAGGGVDNGVVEYSVFEYTSTARSDYTNGVDVHTGGAWIIRNNLFRNIKAPAGSSIAGPAVLMWNRSANSTIEGNTFINCQREIAMGLVDNAANDHSGGIVRNNFIYRAAGIVGDAAIMVNDSPNTQVLHNTILVSGTYPQPIEYRFSGTTGAVIRNNVVDGSVVARDGATGTASGNVMSSAAMFVNPAAGDLHLRATATTAIDKASTIASVPQDFDGEPRPAGNFPDVGADEYYAATTSTPPAPPSNVRIIR